MAPDGAGSPGSSRPSPTPRKASDRGRSRPWATPASPILGASPRPRRRRRSTTPAAPRRPRSPRPGSQAPPRPRRLAIAPTARPAPAPPFADRSAAEARSRNRPALGRGRLGVVIHVSAREPPWGEGPILSRRTPGGIPQRRRGPRSAGPRAAERSTGWRRHRVVQNWSAETTSWPLRVVMPAEDDDVGRVLQELGRCRRRRGRWRRRGGTRRSPGWPRPCCRPSGRWSGG